MKRILCALLAVVLALSVLPFGVLADEDGAAATVTEAFSTDYPNTWVNTGDMAADIAGVAKTQVGYEETTADHTKYNYWYYNSDTSTSWCGTFIAWCGNQAGIPTSILKKNAVASGYSTGTMQNNPYGAPAFAYGKGTPKAGDIAFIAESGSYTSNHVGLVVDVDNSYVYTVEGNVSNTVGERQYAISTGAQKYSGSHILFFVRPNYQNNSVDCKGNHTWGEWKVITESTATTYGKEQRVCSVCRQSETQPLTYLNPFTDLGVLNNDNYYYMPVIWAYSAKPQITNGTTATTFSPKNNCTRAQVVTFLWRAAGQPAHRTTSCQFTDIDKTAYYYDAVLWAVEKGITNGTSETTFSPDNTVTRKEFVTFLWRYAGKPSATAATNGFTDVKDASSYFYHAVMWAASTGVTKGISDTSFAPDDFCIRGQVVTFLYRYMVK